MSSGIKGQCSAVEVEHSDRLECDISIVYLGSREAQITGTRMLGSTVVASLSSGATVDEVAKSQVSFRTLFPRRELASLAT